jgi:hypothetical protein
MGDPERLLSNISDSDDLERELLASIHRMDPPATAQAECWARLSAQIAAVSSAAPPAPVAAQKVEKSPNSRPLSFSVR